MGGGRGGGGRGRKGKEGEGKRGAEGMGDEVEGKLRGRGYRMEGISGRKCLVHLDAHYARYTSMACIKVRYRDLMHDALPKNRQPHER